jgi:hypothetical protein
LYARVSSSVMRSGRSRIKRCNVVRSPGEPAAAPVEGRHGPQSPGTLDPVEQVVDPNVATIGHFAIGFGRRLAREHGLLPWSDRVRIRHARKRSLFDPQLR